MRPARSHRELVVWQKAMDLVELTYQVTGGFPRVERFRLTDQIARAVVSVPANIAEGCGRGSEKDYARFLSVARGSLMETESLLMVAPRLGYVSREQLQPALMTIAEVSKMLTSLRRHLRARRPSS